MNFLDHDYAPRGMDDEAFHEQERQAFSDWMAAEEEYDRMRQEQEREWDQYDDVYDPEEPIRFEGGYEWPTEQEVIDLIPESEHYHHNIDLIPIKWTIERMGNGLGDDRSIPPDVEDEIRCQGPTQSPLQCTEMQTSTSWSNIDLSEFSPDSIPF